MGFAPTWLRQVNPLLHKTTLTMVLGLELGSMYATDRRQSDVEQKHHLMPPPYGGGA